MDSCWAASLGDCCDKLSREHLVSQSVFKDEAVIVQGLPWCKDAPVRIGLANLTAKILCIKHNSDLSPLDESASQTLTTVEEMTAVGTVRRQMKPRLWNVKTFEIDGVSLERWCLKTLINITCDREYPIGRDSNVPGRPSDRLVRIAYGRELFAERAGLYFIVRKGMTLNLVGGRVQCIPLIKNTHYIEGALFMFVGLHLLLFLEPEGPQESLTGIYLNAEHLGDANLNFHTTELRTLLGKYLSHRIHIKW